MKRGIKDRSRKRGNNSRKSEGGERGVESSWDICKGRYGEDDGRNRKMDKKKRRKSKNNNRRRFQCKNRRRGGEDG